jgi:hypothetical protein
MIQLKIARYEHQNSYTISRRSDKEQSVTKYGTFEELVCLPLILRRRGLFMQQDISAT